MGWTEEQAREHCRWIVQQGDHDRYLSSLFAPEAPRGDLWALYAFNFEISRVRELVRDPAAGEVRLNWWENILDDIYACSALDHPVAQGLSRAIDRAELPKQSLVSLIEARRFDLYDDPMPDMETLDTYLTETSGAIFVLASWILSGRAAVSASQAAMHAGLAFGLAGLMRSLPIHRSRGQCFLPVDMLEKRDLTPAHILAGRTNAAVGVMISQLCFIVARRLERARKESDNVPLTALPAFLHVSLIDGYLDRLRTEDFDPLHNVADVSRLKKQWRLMRKSFSEEF